MTKRIALFVSAMLTGIALTTTSISVAPAADECLARPKGLAPAGKHWYFNTDRKLQRKCWYLDDAGEKIVTPAPRKQSVAAASAAPVANAAEPSQKAEARQNVDARAELVEEPRAEQPAAPSLIPPSAPAQPQASQDGGDGTIKRDWAVASRWPEASDTFAASPAPTVLDATPVSRSEAAPPAAPMQEQPAVVGGDSSSGISIDLGLIAAGAIFLVVIGGVIVLFSRRDAAPRDQMMPRAMPRDEKPWARQRAAEPVSIVRPRERRSRHETAEEIEQLLEARRQVSG